MTGLLNPKSSEFQSGVAICCLSHEIARRVALFIFLQNQLLGEVESSSSEEASEKKKMVSPLSLKSCLFHANNVSRKAHHAVCGAQSIRSKIETKN